MLARLLASLLACPPIKSLDILTNQAIIISLIYNITDMESIDSLARAINDFQGGMILVSHDMRLISQVAKEIWICDHQKISRYEGDISSFKMELRKAMHISGEQKRIAAAAAAVSEKANGNGLAAGN